MWFLFGVVFIGAIYIIKNKNKKIEDLTNEKDDILMEIKRREIDINKLEREISNNQKDIEVYKDKISKLEEELKFYTEIKEDSLKLNVKDDDFIEKEKTVEKEKNIEEEKVVKEDKLFKEEENISQKEEKILKEDNIVSNDVDIDINEDIQGKQESKEDNKKIEEISPVEIELSKEQKEIYDIMENTTNNMFITGKAGTGKSYLLRFFRKHTKKKTLYTAPTGIAALNIEGVTLHSVFGFDNLIEGKPLKLGANQSELFKKLDTLIIDEISMVRVDVLERIDKILKIVNENTMPFGGKQVILFGDLFQLPPVANREETQCLTSKYGNIFFFNSYAFRNGQFIFKELNEIHRQTDKQFIKILNNIREGNVSEEEIDILNTHYTEKVPRRVIQVVPKRNLANQINVNNLEKINSREYIYTAEITQGKEHVKENEYQCDFELKLKVGALVMMIANDKEHRRWVNGTLGIISGLTPNSIKVTIDGIEYEVDKYNFMKYKCTYNKEKQKLEYEIESCVRQFPIILAYAITIHKSQGMTYQQIACDLKECFAPGQSYVALSRCANFDKLYLTTKIDENSILVNNAVANFYKEQLYKTA